MIEEKKVIVYIGGFEIPDKNAAAHRVMNNAKILHLLDYHIVFCGVDKQIKENTINPITVSEFESFPMYYPSNCIEWFRQLYNFSHLNFVLEKYKDSLKAVIAYNMHAHPLKKLITYCKKNGVLLISDITEWYDNSFSLKPISFFKWLDTKIVMTRYYKKVDGMISISSYLSNYYRPFVKNILEVPPLIDIEDDCWHQKPCISDYVSFVYAGLPDKSKDEIGLIVSAFASISKDYTFRFNVVGISREQFSKDYPSLSKSLLTLESKIVFWGRVTHKESVKQLLSSDYCIFLRERSRKNMAGFPTKFVECITSRIGIIANDVSNIKDYFPRDNCILIPNLEVDTIRKTIEFFIKKGKVNHGNLDSIFDYRKYISSFKFFIGEIDE